MTSYVNVAFEDPYFDTVSGEPHAWWTDVASSSTSALVANEISHPNGVATVVGCLEIHWVFVDKPGAPATETQALGDYVPLEMTVEYEPSSEQWLVTGFTELTGESNEPTCPLVD